jgi:hypothetical protein
MMLHRRRFLVGTIAVLAACWATLPSSASLAEEAARWYRGNTHAHSFWSDGDEFPEMVADWYKSHGYDFLAISDHDTIMSGKKWKKIDGGESSVPSAVVEKCQKRFGADWLDFRTRKDQRQVKLKTFDEVCGKLVDPKFLLIRSEEVSAKFDHQHVHLNAVNLAEIIEPAEGSSVTDTIMKNVSAAEEQSRRLNRPVIVHVNHPNWSRYDISPEDLAQAATARFFEVCNAGTASWHYGDAGHPSIEKLWDIANTIRIAKMKAAPLYGIGSDDAHAYQEFSSRKANPGRAWIMVRAKRLDTDSLLDAVSRGDFYASTGVVLRDVAYDAKQRTITVKVQPEPGVRYTIEFIGTLEGADPTGKPIETTVTHDENAENGENNEDDEKPKRPGCTYSPEVGKVLAKVEGDTATYHFTGKELYVRAVVRSDRPIVNAPKGDMQTQEAWCQPMGWQKN